MVSERKNTLKIAGVLFAGFVTLALLFPYTGDDWSWGSSIGLGRLQSFFVGYNGRYAGNLLVLALTRSKLLDAVIMAASFTMACFLGYAYSADKSKTALLFAAVLFFLMPKEMWAQVVVWTAGFTNYVPSALITVFYLLRIREITGTKLSDRRDTVKDGLWMAGLGFVGALFVESVTVFHICLAVAGMVYMFLKFRKYRLGQAGFLLGSLLGVVVMFSNGAYDRIAQGEDYYRHMPGSFRDTVYFAVDQAGSILDYILYGNLRFCVVVTVLLMILAVWRIKTANRKIVATVPAVLYCCSLLLLWNKEKVFSAVTSRIAMKALWAGCIPIAIALLYVCSILVMVLCYVEKGRRFRMLLPFYCAVVSLAPLLIVDPIGPRCVFLAYLLMMVFAVDVLGYVRKQTMPQETWLCKLLALVTAIQFLFCLYIFYPIHHYDSLRLDYIKRQAEGGKKEVLMCDLPNSEYVWDGTPGGESWSNKYKLFYGLEEDLQFTVVPYYEFEHLMNGDF